MRPDAITEMPAAGAATAPGEATIRVTLLGTGMPVPAPDRAGPATLIEAGGQTLLFDAGRGVATRLFQLGVPLRAVAPLFLTHFHSDHTLASRTSG
jgi:ribonuclease Z